MQLLFLLLLLVVPYLVLTLAGRWVGGHGAGPAYLLVRVPFQIFVICWTYFATGQSWQRKRLKEA